MAQNRLDVLDGLRGLAVVLVVWFHIWQISWLPAPIAILQFIPETGFIGVHLFFFLSGFVIAYPFVRAAFDRTEPPAWGHFAYRRAIKIVPSYVLSIALCYAIGYQHRQSSAGALEDILSHLFFVHNLWPDTYGAINGVLWTLAVEVQFYCIFPIIWPAFARRPIITFLGLNVLAIAYRLHVQSAPDASRLIELLPGYLDLFACGMIAAYAYVRLRAKSAYPAVRVSATLFALVGFALLTILMESLFSVRHAQSDWPLHWEAANRTWLAFAFAFIALASLCAASWWKRLLANPFLVFFSIISYNLYIYHQLVARELLSLRIPSWAGTSPQFDHHWQIWYTAIAFPATIVVAAIVTYGFERPLLRTEPQFWFRYLEPLWQRTRSAGR
ncbi:MAG: hypothetical protein DLM50_08250 [Candidatus Meridianibacter frigidus]|nr:MAG: hypothetical protein DLM50_08250 [Candidatus Eremiobacteraeota bacterium]